MSSRPIVMTFCMGVSLARCCVMGIHEQMLGGAAPCDVVNVSQCLGKFWRRRVESAAALRSVADDDGEQDMGLGDRACATVRFSAIVRDELSSHCRPNYFC